MRRIMAVNEAENQNNDDATTPSGRSLPPEEITLRQ
jgi:hypothetical protein